MKVYHDESHDIIYDIRYNAPLAPEVGIVNIQYYHSSTRDRLPVWPFLASIRGNPPFLHYVRYRHVYPSLISSRKRETSPAADRNGDAPHLRNVRFVRRRMSSGGFQRRAMGDRKQCRDHAARTMLAIIRAQADLAPGHAVAWLVVALLDMAPGTMRKGLPNYHTGNLQIARGTPSG